MFAYLISKAFSLIFGLLYPAFCSYKAVKTKDVKEYVNWMMYWIVFSIYTFLENFADIFIGFWFPFYYELKIVFLLWLLSPSARGGCTVYRRIVHPFLAKHESEIEQFIANFKSQSSTMIIQAGFQGFRYASKLIMSSTVGEGLNLGQNHFLSEMRKTFSLNDLNRERYPEDMPDMNGIHDLSSIVEELNQRNIAGAPQARSQGISSDEDDLPRKRSPAKRGSKAEQSELNGEGETEGNNEEARTRLSRKKRDSGEMYLLHKEDIPLLVSLLASQKPRFPGVEETREESELSDDDFFDCPDSSSHSIAERVLESSALLKPRQAVKMVGKTRLQAFENVEVSSPKPPPITPRIHKQKPPDLPMTSQERLKVKK